MNNSHQTQIIPRKWKHICINRNREEKYNQSLDVEAVSSQRILTHFHKLYNISKLSLRRPYSFPPTPGIIPST